MKVQFEDQLRQKDEKIGGLEERFEGVEDQRRQRDLVINHLMYVANRMEINDLNIVTPIFHT